MPPPRCTRPSRRRRRGGWPASWSSTIRRSTARGSTSPNASWLCWPLNAWTAACRTWPPSDERSLHGKYAAIRSDPRSSGTSPWLRPAASSSTSILTRHDHHGGPLAHLLHDFLIALLGNDEFAVRRARCQVLLPGMPLRLGEWHTARKAMCDDDERDSRHRGRCLHLARALRVIDSTTHLVGRRRSPPEEVARLVGGVHHHQAGRLSGIDPGIQPHVHAAEGMTDQHERPGKLHFAQERMQVMDDLLAHIGSRAFVAVLKGGAVVHTRSGERGHFRLNEGPGAMADIRACVEHRRRAALAGAAHEEAVTPHVDLHPSLAGSELRR